MSYVALLKMRLRATEKMGNHVVHSQYVNTYRNNLSYELYMKTQNTY
jgi:hypothetical protein